jgi:hypothetical protein
MGQHQTIYEITIKIETHAVERGQSDFAPRDEESPSNKDLEAISQVGHAQLPEKGARQAGGSGRLPRDLREWLSRATPTIGQDSSDAAQGWIYRRTQTGHRRERAARRDSVS